MTSDAESTLLLLSEPPSRRGDETASEVLDARHRQRRAVQDEQIERFREAGVEDVRYVRDVASAEEVRCQNHGPRDVFVSIGDGLVERGAVARLRAVDADVAVAVEGFPDSASAKEADVSLDDDVLAVTDVDGFRTVDGDERPDVRTLGVASVSRGALKQLWGQLNAVANATNSRDRRARFTRLLVESQDLDVNVQAVDVSEWTLGFAQKHALARYVLGTKADTLDRLDGLVDNAQVPRHTSFEVDAWQRNRNQLLDRIQSAYPTGPVVVRSSAVTEDGWSDSRAGAFNSVLNVDPADRVELQNTVDRVVESLRCESDADGRDQVLVQSQVEQIALSGVAFTRDLNTGSPYTVINYDDTTGRTDTVTGGQGEYQRTAYVLQGTADSYSVDTEADLSGVRSAIDELRALLDDPPLDIEFAVDTDGNVMLLQVRPLTTLGDEETGDESEVPERVADVVDIVERRQRPRDGLLGRGTVLGVMPDWNPAEIVGRNPDPLAVSLYRYLITDGVWAKARAAMGYRDVGQTPLLVTMAGRPYVDARVSFNSFVPATLPESLGERLVTHYLDRLAERPELQDRIEFDVAFTCLDFAFDQRVDQLRAGGFSNQEIAVLRDQLQELTESVVTEAVTPIREQTRRLTELGDRRRALLRGMAPAPANWPETVRLVRQLLDDARTYGTLPFSILARQAFIATAFLRSLVDRDVLTDDEFAAVSRGIPTIAHELTDDVQRMEQGELDPEAFLKRFGHLRPGTYDICSPRYDAAPENYFDVDSTGIDPLELDRERVCEVSDWQPRTTPDAAAVFDRCRGTVRRLIEREGFGFSPESLFDFVTRTIPLRELAKFEFTRNLSTALTLLRRSARSNFGLAPEAVARLTLDDVFDSVDQPRPPSPGSRLADETERRQDRTGVDNRVHLPPLIREADDVLAFEVRSERPSFVTNQKRNAPVVRIEAYDDFTHAGLDGHVVLIPSADPGYDWIFGSDIAGLITKYGGIASHMAIRAAEFGIPAAIGCGELLYERISQADVVELDCMNGRIHEVR